VCQNQDVIDAVCRGVNVFEMSATILIYGFDICGQLCLCFFFFIFFFTTVNDFNNKLLNVSICKHDFFVLVLSGEKQFVLIKKDWTSYRATSENVSISTDTQREFLSFIYTFTFPSRQT